MDLYKLSTKSKFEFKNNMNVYRPPNPIMVNPEDEFIKYNYAVAGNHHSHKH